MWMKDRGGSPVLPLRYREPAGAGARHAIFNLTPNMPCPDRSRGRRGDYRWRIWQEVAVSPAGVLVVEPAILSSTFVLIRTLRPSL